VTIVQSMTEQAPPPLTKAPPGGDYALYAFLLLHCLYCTSVYAFFYAAATSILLTLLFLPILFFLFAFWVERRRRPLIIFSAISLFVLFQIWVFSAISGYGFSIKSFSHYYTILSFVVFWYYIGTPQQHKILDILFMICLIYCFFYCFLMIVVGAKNVAMVLPDDARYYLIRNDSYRGGRITCAPFLAIFVLFYGITNLHKHASPLAVASFLFGGTTLLLSQGRTLLAIAALILLVYFGTRSRRAIALMSILVFLIGCGLILYGGIDVNWNPYSMFAGDESASVRANSYDIARYYLYQHPIFGIGYESKAQNMYDFIGSRSFYVSDIGIMGIYLTLGGLGAILYVSSVILLNMPFLRTLEEQDNYTDALCLVASELGMFSAVSPSVWYEDASIFFAIILAWALKTHGTFINSPDRIPRKTA
jgi:O-antigen ligase